MVLRNLSSSSFFRIIFYNAMLAGLGMLLVKAFLNSQNEFYLFFIIIFLLLFDSFIERKKVKDYGLSLPKRRDVKLALMVFCMFFPVSVACRIFFPQFDFWYAIPMGLDKLNLFKMIVYYIPISVLVQEFGLRLLFQSKLSSIYGGRLATYSTISNFALLHIGWFFVSTTTNFIIIFLTVIFGSVLLALLFQYTKNVISTVLAHLVLNTASVIQIFLHINNSIYEQLLWLVWGISFVLVSPIVFNHLKKSFVGDVKRATTFSDKMVLILLSIFPLLLMLLLRSL